MFLISEHTINSMPDKGDRILDVGCRAYDFCLPLAERGCAVLAIEPDVTAPDSPHKNITVLRRALVSPSQVKTKHELVIFGNGTGNHLQYLGDAPGTKKVEVVSIDMLGDSFEIVKLDCEGAEYDILLEWPGPIANQITVEFHEHTGANKRGKKVYEEIFNHLGQWYEIVQHEMSVRHCISTPNYWDSLFVLKGL